MFRRSSPTTPDPFTPPDWSGDACVHLESMRLYAEKKIQNELNWYYRRKSGRSATSQALRFFAVILSVLGGLVPVLISVFGSRPRWHWLDTFAGLRFGQLGYLFLAVAGGTLPAGQVFRVFHGLDALHCGHAGHREGAGGVSFGLGDTGAQAVNRSSGHA